MGVGVGVGGGERHERDPHDRAPRAEGAVRPGDGLHPAGRLHRPERLPLLPAGGAVRRRVAPADARLPALAAALRRAGGDDAGPRRGRAQRHAGGGARPADHGARAAARQVRGPAAVPARRRGDDARDPRRPGSGREAGSGGRAGPVRRLGAARRGAGGGGRVGLERHPQPDHGVYPRRRGDVRADPGGPRPPAGGSPARARRRRRVAGCVVPLQRDRPRRARSARRHLLRDTRGAVPSVRLLRADAPQAHPPRRAAPAAAAGRRAARDGPDRGEPVRPAHRGAARSHSREGLHALPGDETDRPQSARSRDGQTVRLDRPAARGGVPEARRGRPAARLPRRRAGEGEGRRAGPE